MRIEELLDRNPDREITSVVKITDHEAHRVWTEMDEYVPTDKVKTYFRDIAEMLAETRQGATERVCVWLSGFFGSGKSHFTKVLGYLLEDRKLVDPDGHTHSSSELLARKLSLENFLPLLTTELRARVVYINLLDYDPQAQDRPTFSRLIYRGLLEHRGLSTMFWVAEWEKELQQVGKWSEFEKWVVSTFGRPWDQERKLNAEAVLSKALPVVLPELYKTEEDAKSALRDSKHRYSTVEPSTVVASLWEEAKGIDPERGRVVVLLDEVGLYIGDSVERLTDLNALAEQVHQQSEGKVILVATAQEALTDLVPRLTADRQILEWLRDRFRLTLGLEPSEVKAVVADRLLRKTPQGAVQLRRLYQAESGNLRAALAIDRNWTEDDFVAQYPLPPYTVPLTQAIIGAMRGSVEEARRLSGAQRSMLKLSQAILTGEGGIVRGAQQQIGWLAGLDVIYDALAPDLRFVRADQLAAIQQLEQLGDVDGLSVAKVAKALFLLQQVSKRYPSNLDNLVSALVANAGEDTNALRQAIGGCLEKLQESGWVIQEDGQYRLLTPTEHDLENDVRRNWPSVGKLKDGAVNLVKTLLENYRYEHGRIRRPLRVAMEVDGQVIEEDGDLAVELFTPFAEETPDEILGRSIGEPETLFLKAGDQADLKPVLERTLAIEETLKQWRSRTLSDQQQKHRDRLEREAQTARQTRLTQLLQKAFLDGRIYLAGKDISPSGNSLRSALDSQLAGIAKDIFTEFIDDRPEKDDDCAAILNWQPGTALPDVYARLNLLTATNQIRHDLGPLHTVKLELRRRSDRGLDRDGKELHEHYEKKPYGWDPRLVRLLLATLFKAGIIGVVYQGRNLSGPTDPQARLVFSGVRDFQRATFDLLPEVDWRKASDLCSQLFGVDGGDTFERTATVVKEQAMSWKQEAEQLAIRCRDNQLPQNLGNTCHQTAETLGGIAQLADPNGRLRRFLDQAETLSGQMPTLRALKTFDFAEYRRVRSFTQAVGDWARMLSGEASERWQRLLSDLTAPDLSSRWAQAKQDYAFLLSRYRTDYVEGHRIFQEAVQAALQILRQHEAFQHKPEAAEQALGPVKALTCGASPVAVNEESFRCADCRQSYAGLSKEVVAQYRRQAEAVLDNLLPRPSDGPIRPLAVRRTVVNEGEIEALADELLRYRRKAKGPIEVTIEASPKEDGR
ncbi:MAG: BREX system P-loop protein BrxC [Chloroflexi bacterium]|nr:BREX system P-loop protein BrxC [Chloroflexota bacterium]MDA8187559.1 BREX system P-loop protein BrxC [Dehalococcoidales bacterium]